eukprot:9037100-Ditylum_brightwellii.AAC.1
MVLPISKQMQFVSNEEEGYSFKNGIVMEEEFTIVCDDNDDGHIICSMKHHPTDREGGISSTAAAATATTTNSTSHGAGVSGNIDLSEVLMNHPSSSFSPN